MSGVPVAGRDRVPRRVAPPVPRLPPVLGDGPVRYVRRGWREVQPGDVIKDPRGDRVIDHVSRWGFRLRTDDDHPYEFMNRLPTVGRFKVIVEE